MFWPTRIGVEWNTPYIYYKIMYRVFYMVTINYFPLCFNMKYKSSPMYNNIFFCSDNMLTPNI